MRRPVPGQQLIAPCGRLVRNAGKNIGEPCLRIDIVELCGLDERVDDGGAPAATIGAAEQPRLAAERDAAESALGGVVAEAGAAVVEEAGVLRLKALIWLRGSPDGYECTCIERGAGSAERSKKSDCLRGLLRPRSASILEPGT